MTTGSTHGVYPNRIENFEPKIIAFLCNWCSYAGADLCGVSRYQYPTNIRPIRVMCSTRVPPHIILEAFEKGADGVLFTGCHIGDCHYISGNYYTEKRAKATKKLMECAGMEPQRLRLEWVSASEGERFSKLVAQFVDEIKKLGPNAAKTDEKKRMALRAAVSASEDFRIRVLIGKEIKVTEKGNVYGEIRSKDEIDRLLYTTIEDVYYRQRILQLAKDTPKSVKELSSMVSLPSYKVLEHVTALRAANLLGLDRVDGATPFYRTFATGGA